MWYPCSPECSRLCHDTSTEYGWMSWMAIFRMSGTSQNSCGSIVSSSLPCTSAGCSHRTLSYPRAHFRWSLSHSHSSCLLQMRFERLERPQRHVLEVVLAQIEPGQGAQRPERVRRHRDQPVAVQVQLLQRAQMAQRVLVDALQLVGGRIEHAQLLQVLRELVQLADAVGGQVERLEQPQPLQPLLRQQLQLVHAQIEQLQAGEGDERAGRDAVDAVVRQVQPLHRRVQLEVFAGDDRQVGAADDELAQVREALLVGVGRDALQRVAGEVEPGQPGQRRLREG
uniref:Uncharacterized protein n=1 Tax=Anopheles merus TaxID=30066 RepID=A0A182USR4_ANOME